MHRGKQLELSIYLNATSVVTPFAQELRVTLPNGYLSGVTTLGQNFAIPDISTTTGEAVAFQALASVTYMRIIRNLGVGGVPTNWIAATSTCYVFGQLFIDIV